MLYAADIFLTPPTVRPTANVGRNGRAIIIINKLASVQRRATLNIAGGMRTAPTDALDVLADILSSQLLVSQHCKQAALRLAILRETHPPRKPITSAACQFVKSYATPLHFLMHELGRDPKAVRRRIRWKAAFITELAETREDAEVAELQGIITQVIMGHIPLAKHLHQIKKADSPVYAYCHEHETVAHFTLHCLTHWMARATLFEGTPYTERNLTQLLSIEETRARLLDFIAHTTRLQSVDTDGYNEDDEGGVGAVTRNLHATRRTVMAMFRPR